MRRRADSRKRRRASRARTGSPPRVLRRTPPRREERVPFWQRFSETPVAFGIDGSVFGNLTVRRRTTLRDLISCAQRFRGELFVGMKINARAERGEVLARLNAAGIEGMARLVALQSTTFSKRRKGAGRA